MKNAGPRRGRLGLCPTQAGGEGKGRGAAHAGGNTGCTVPRGGVACLSVCASTSCGDLPELWLRGVLREGRGDNHSGTQSRDAEARALYPRGGADAPTASFEPPWKTAQGARQNSTPKRRARTQATHKNTELGKLQRPGLRWNEAWRIQCTAQWWLATKGMGIKGGHARKHKAVTDTSRRVLNSSPTCPTLRHMLRHSAQCLGPQTCHEATITKRCTKG